MPVAVKELLRSITGDDMHREMGILRTVTHRNVVRYYTHASDASYHYLVLERCECSLEQAVRQSGDVGGGWPGPMVEGAGRMPTPEAMVVAAGMVEGVAELHRVGVVHRDLKPSNILLSRDEGGGGGYGGGGSCGQGCRPGAGEGPGVRAELIHEREGRGDAVLAGTGADPDAPRCDSGGFVCASPPPGPL